MSLSASTWDSVTFRDMLEEPVRNGIYKKKEFHGRGAKIVNMGELFKYPRLRNVDMKRVELSTKEKEKCLLAEGDLIFARRSLTAEGAGKCNIIYALKEETTFESSIIRARPDKKQVSSVFLYYYFNASYGKYLLGTILRQVAVAGITGTDLMDLTLNIPSLKEQKAIASVLSNLDDKIDLLHRQNKTLESLAETLFRQWFVEETGDWEERPLSSIATFLNGVACKKYPPENGMDKFPVLKIKELRSGISESSDWASSDIDAKYIVNLGDVIFSWSASLMVKMWNGDKCVLNQHLFKVTSNVFPKWFYFMWSKYHLAEFIAISQAHATTMGHIKRGDLDEAMVLVPGQDELDEMSVQITPVIDKQVTNARQISLLENLRDSLLPKLMSGEVRVAL